MHTTYCIYTAHGLPPFFSLPHSGGMPPPLHHHLPSTTPHHLPIPVHQELPFSYRAIFFFLRFAFLRSIPFSLYTPCTPACVDLPTIIFLLRSHTPTPLYPSIWTYNFLRFTYLPTIHSGYRPPFTFYYYLHTTYLQDAYLLHTVCLPPCYSTHAHCSFYLWDIHACTFHTTCLPATTR